VAFRRRFFTSIHHGYRTKGRTPAEVVKTHRKQTEVSS
jgi:hypothetical protein